MDNKNVHLQVLTSYDFPLPTPPNHVKTTINTLSWNKIPLVIVACGSFSPITYLHLRLFEVARNWINVNCNQYEVLAGYLSPVGDAYKKHGLECAKHRIEMCRLAVKNDISMLRDWILVDDWEARHTEYKPTAQVLKHFNEEINEKRGGLIGSDGVRRKSKIMFLGGADLLSSMTVQGVWDKNDLDNIFREYGVLIVERVGTDIDQVIEKLNNYTDHILIIKENISNDISSTKVRQLIRLNQSIRYLVPDRVLEYIATHRLYRYTDSKR